MRANIACLAACLLFVGTVPGFAADARRGEALAERWCSECHVVSARQSQGSTQAPPFSEIADRKSFDAGKVALFLLAPHPPMQDLNLSRNDAADLAAYIASQGE